MAKCFSCYQEQENRYFLIQRHSDGSFIEIDGFCLLETECFFCSYLAELKGERMQIKTLKVDADVFKAWLESTQPKIENMTLEQIEARIQELTMIEFYSKQESALLAKKRSDLRGGAQWRKNSEDISDAEYKVSLDPPRKARQEKPKAEPKKKESLLDGLNLAAMKEELARLRANKK